MATSNVKVLLSGKDDLTPQIKQAEASLASLSSKADKLDKIQRDFDKITNSTKPLRVQLKQLQTLMGQMNFDGLDNSPLFTQMAQRAGELADAMGDARTAVNAFANDNFKLEAMAQGLTLVASAGSIATGVMGLFGTENEKVTQAILKVQSALAILNGVQAIANALNKDSALMLRLKQIRMVASTKATVADSVATSANSVSMGANTVATRLAQKAREKLNYTIAIGKALMGDWTGLLLVGAAALTTYAIATSDSTDKLDKENKKLEEAETSFSKYQKEVGNATANITAKMTILKTQWETLRTEAEKTQWIKDNKNAFDEMGIAINNVTDAENLFINHTNEVVSAMIARAKAQAAANKLTNDEVERDDKLREVNKKYDSYIDDNLPVKKGQTITVKKANELGINSDNSKIYHTVSGEDIATLNKRLSEEGERLRQKELDSINAHYDHIKKENIDLLSDTTKAELEAEKEVSKYFKRSGNNDKKNPKATQQKEEKVKVEVEIEPDSLEASKKQYQEWEKGLSSTNWEERGEKALSSYLKYGEKLKKEIESKEIKLGIKPTIEEGSSSALEKEISDVMKKIGNINPQLHPEKYQELINKLVILKKAQKEYNDELERLTDIEPKATIHFDTEKLVKGNDEDKRQSYENAMSKIQDIGAKVSMQITGKEEAQSEIDKIVEQLQAVIPDLKIKVKVKEDGSIETIKNDSISTAEAFSMAGQAIQGMGQAIGNLAQENEGLAKAVLVAQAVGQLVLSFAQAMSQAAAQGPWAWIAAGVAGAATLTALIAQMQSFEQGGIVQGSSYIGDKTLVRANAGEMILNRKQQNNLYKAIKNDNLGNNGIGGNVTFRIDGTTLKGVLNNTNRKIAKQS